MLTKLWLLHHISSMFNDLRFLCNLEKREEKQTEATLKFYQAVQERYLETDALSKVSQDILHF